MSGPGAMRHTPPSGATPHEMAHACQMHANVHSPGSGFWWEAHANWMMLQYINSYPQITIINQQAAFYWGHGRHYYDCWQIFEHLKEEPGFGYDFITRLWAEGDDMEYIWNKAEKLAAPRSMADEWGKMARRNITWDYARHDFFTKQDTDPNKLRHGRVLLEPVPFNPGCFRVPWAMAPQQFGYNLCPLKPTARTVSADFQGYADLERGSDWRASFVAVGQDGRPHYSSLWNGGRHTFQLKPDDKELYLVVSATPKVMELKPDQDYRSPLKSTFPYRASFTGAEPLDLMADPGPPVNREGYPIPGKPHSNGGGFVAASAKVAASAYVGPNARVLDEAQVSGSARIEDRAVVRGRAVVKDRAVLSGHALAQDTAQISGNGHVSDYAVASQFSVITGRARLLEYAVSMGQGKVDGRATMKGRSVSWGEHIGGTAMLDGDYANGIGVDKNVWFLWFVNDQKKADAAEDLHGIYAQYRFEKKHPYLAWDTYGATHGLLVGYPEIRAVAQAESVAGADAVPAHALVLDGSSQYVELRPDIAYQCDLSAQLKVCRGPLAADQTLFEFASPDGKNRVALILVAPKGQPTLAVRRNGVETLLTAPYQLREGKWTKVGISLGEAGAMVMLNDRIAAEAPRLTVEPWNLGLRAGVLGRGVGGGWFKGSLAEVTFSSVPLVDRRPPAPDPAQWSQPPTVLNRRTLFMRAVMGEQTTGGIEYRFRDPQFGLDSNWQPSPEFTAKNLRPGHQYKIAVTMRDAAGKTGRPSELALVTLPETEPPAYSLKNGVIVFEAERFQASTKADRGEWIETADQKYSGGKGMEVPDRGATANTESVVAGLSPRLDYRIDFPKPGKYFVSVRCWAIHGGNNSFYLGCDFTSEPKRVEFSPQQLAWCEPVEIEITEPGVHLVQVWMDRDGAVLDQVGVAATKSALEEP